ncbi:MAG: glycosyltransferase family 2 protein [Oscillospiraceae bacterium]
MIFSVVIPVYNVKDYLPKCIDSVLAQDFEDYEVILIDDGSTDGESGAICDRYAAAHPERIRAIHKPNGGVGEARNVGIEAPGQYLIFIDSDDYIPVCSVYCRRRCPLGVTSLASAQRLRQTVSWSRAHGYLPTDHTFTLADTPG